ncbi:uncharacterized protein LOC131683533 isoform X2 [Topomyia yanbarensis]|uniref:uncharacterized protein LOC131683533 isoform X2 n=1 Tax=Topomyia yanbarensis TaxID=2498891 RepID=UPI00273B924D|nr:uncharacterized protein LOC131683533 isoform X2 [Topomyia yanbarensis]
MVKRGRRRGKKALKRDGSQLVAKPSSATSNIDFSPRVHPSTNDCYPLNKLCRLCLLSNTNMEPIFSFPGDDRLVDKIFQCTNLKISENDNQGIPTSICGQCKKQLDQCYEFRLLCWKNNEVLHNLHAILSPRKATAPIARPEQTILSNPVVQLKKLDMNAGPSQRDQIDLSKLCSTPRAGKRGNSSRRSFGEISLNQLYTPTRRGHKASSIYPRFSKELVVRLSPISAALINKYKKVAGSTKTKAAVKSFAQPVKPRGRPKSFPQSVTKAKPPSASKPPPVFKSPSPAKSPSATKTRVEKRTPKVTKATKPIKSPKATKPKPAAPVAKKPKVKRVEIAMPPKKRKENFAAVVPTTVTCLLCSQSFVSQKTLSRHMATHENNRKLNRIFNCDACHKEYLKPSQLAEHLSSAEHIVNAGSDEPDQAAEESILPDNNDDDDEGEMITDDNPPVVPVEVAHDTSAEVEDITDQPAHEEIDRQQPSPDTNVVSQHSDDHGVEDNEQQMAQTCENEGEQPSARENVINRDASPIPVDSESSRSRDGGVQYSDVCSTNNEENLFNGSGTDVFNSSRRVTFSDITEVVD